MEEKKTKIQNGTPNNLDTKAAIEALEYLLAAGYVNKRRLYLANFVRGIFFSIGTIVGLAIVSTIVLGILSQFDYGPVNIIQDTVQGALDVRK